MLVNCDDDEEDEDNVTVDGIDCWSSLREIRRVKAMIFSCVDSLSLRLCCATTEGVLHCAFRNELLVLFPLKLQSVQCILRDTAVDISLFSGSALHHVVLE